MNHNGDIDNYFTLRKHELSKWLVFIRERFEPVSHFVLIFLFVGTHFLVANATTTIDIKVGPIIWIAFGTTAFFLKLRFYDEIKDYEVDLDKNPDRPLPRGLVTHNDLKRGIENCIILELLLFWACGSAGLLGIIVAIGYSLLMYHEFFIGDYIRPHLTTYAVSHTVVTFFISMALFSALSGKHLWQLDSDFYLFGLINWPLFNIFELGRKTYQPCEERQGVDTYSKVWGKSGAFLLVYIHAMAIGFLSLHISSVDGIFMKKFMSINLALLLIVGIFYLIDKKPLSGKIFRIFSSLYIIIIYLGFIANYAMQAWY